MPERATNRYKPLFEVRLLHHYWLDDGAIVFDKIAEEAKQVARLAAYDMRTFLAVRPTATSARQLSSFRCLFREGPLGCIVLVPDAANVPPDTTLEFIVTATHGSFYNYTALTLRLQKVYELNNPLDGVWYRYKENAPVLSNLTGTARVTGANKSLFLSREIASQTADDQVEALVLSGATLLQLTSDGPSASTQVLDPHATDLPVFVHQADAPAIVPPAGLTGAPTRGIRLSSDIPDDVSALLSLTAIRPDDDAFSFVDGAGAAKVAHPVYQVRFKNRSTIWTYLNKRTGAVDWTEAHPLPLTYFGNAGTKQKPSEGTVKAKKSGTKITQLVSEIYV